MEKGLIKKMIVSVCCPNLHTLTPLYAEIAKFIKDKWSHCNDIAYTEKVLDELVF